MTIKTDEFFLRAAITLAASAREHGNHPFGALLVDAQGNILLTAENTVNTSRDVTGHAELNLVREASGKFTPLELSGVTLYTSTEPCPMCSGAIYWSGIGKVVYALSETGLNSMFPEDAPDILQLGCREVFDRGGRPVEVVGPLLEVEGAKVHQGFWNS